LFADIKGCDEDGDEVTLEFVLFGCCIHATERVNATKDKKIQRNQEDSFSIKKIYIEQ
jgi:hypothetical protein